MSDEDEVVDALGTWDRSTLPANIDVGADVVIESRRLLAPFRSTRQPGLVIGDRVRLYAGGWGGALTVEANGFLEIGDDSILTGAQIMCSDHVRIGRRVTISYNAVIADSDFHPRDPDLRRTDAISGAPYGTFTGYAPQVTAPVVVDDEVVIGINAIVLKGVTIGRGAQVYAGAVVTADVAPGAVVRGNPARPVEP